MVQWPPLGPLQGGSARPKAAEHRCCCLQACPSPETCFSLCNGLLGHSDSIVGVQLSWAND